MTLLEIINKAVADMGEAKIGTQIKVRLPTDYTSMIDWSVFQNIAGVDSGDETQIESAYPSPSSEKLNSKVVADTEEERERLWKLVRQYASG